MFVPCRPFQGASAPNQTTLSIKIFSITLGISEVSLNDTQHYNISLYAECHNAECRIFYYYAECHYAECHYAECRSAFSSQVQCLQVMTVPSQVEYLSSGPL